MTFYAKPQFEYIWMAALNFEEDPSQSKEDRDTAMNIRLACENNKSTFEKIKLIHPELLKKILSSFKESLDQPFEWYNIDVILKELTYL